MRSNEIAVPISFWLHGQEYRIKYDPTLCAKSGNRGEVRSGYNEIVLQSAEPAEPHPQSQIEQAFLHELVHGILFHMESKKNDDEAFVNQFANLLHQALATAEYKEADIVDFRRLEESMP